MLCKTSEQFAIWASIF